MSTSPTPTVLSPEEWKLIEAIRALPDSSLQTRVPEVLTEILFYIRNPRCQGIGAEGFPCGEPVSTCDECHEVWDLLESVAARVKAG